MCSVKLMLVDDSDVDRYIARRLFSNPEQPMEIIELPDGRDALEYLSENEIAEDRILLILLDINMPIVNGFEFLQEFAALKTRRPDLDRCVINVMTSSNHPEDVDRTASFPFVRRHIVKMPSASEAREIITEASQKPSPA